MSIRSGFLIVAVSVSGIIGASYLFQYTECVDFDTVEMVDMEPQLIPKKSYCSCEFPAILTQIEVSDPDRDALQAISEDDYRLRSVGTLSIGSYTPGVDIETRERFGEVFIDGTSDVVLCYEHARLMLIARKYAQIYNLNIVASIIE